MIKSNLDCMFLHDVFDQYCNLFKGYKHCDKTECKVFDLLKENEQLKAQNEKMKKCAICSHRKSDIEPCDNCKRTNPNASNDYWDLDLSIE